MSNDGDAPHGAKSAPQSGDVAGAGVTDGGAVGAMTQADMATANLIARLEDAAGPDRELDGMLWLWMFGSSDGWLELSTINGNWCAYEPNGKGGGRLSEPKKGQPKQCSPFTASLDSALKLVREGNSVHLHIMPREIGHKAEVGIGHEGYSKSAPIALCIAALKAGTAQSQERTEPSSTPAEQPSSALTRSPTTVNT